MTDKTKKTISIMIPCYNEAENVEPISERIIEIMTGIIDEDVDYNLREIPEQESRMGILISEGSAAEGAAI